MHDESHALTNAMLAGEVRRGGEGGKRPNPSSSARCLSAYTRYISLSPHPSLHPPSQVPSTASRQVEIGFSPFGNPWRRALMSSVAHPSCNFSLVCLGSLLLVLLQR